VSFSCISLFEIAKYLGLEIEEKDLTSEDLLASDEIFFTGTATEVVGIVSIDKVNIGDGSVGPITSSIRNKYLEIVNGKEDNFKNYITLI
jgi:branched-chain amino acid aminotransferase